jgi:NAD kinase
MNHSSKVFASEFPPEDVIFRQLPMLYVELERADGTRFSTYGFNDAWVERSTSQSAWIEVSVNGVRRLPKLVSDGALVATAAGSTAYARSMGASPLLADTPAWLLVGSNVMEPIDWKSALLSVDTCIELLNLDPQHRPLRAYVDGQDQGEIVSLKASISKAAAAELVFNADHDMAEKIAAIQFRSVALEESGAS